MKKVLSLIFIFCVLVSCKKENRCWKCDMIGTVNGVIYPSQTICTDSIPKVLYDPNGNPINFECHK